MSYEVVLSPKARKELLALNKEIGARIAKKVAELQLAPYHFVEKMTDVDCWKLRVGDYRVLLDIIENEKRIEVLRVGHRKNIYKRWTLREGEG